MTETPQPIQTELYTDLSDIPLYNWIEIATTNNLKWLVKSGPVPEDLTEQYGELLQEYQALIKDTKSAHEHNIKVTYARLANRIDHIQIAVNALRLHGHDANLIRILQTPPPDGLGFEGLTYEDLERDLKLTENYMKVDVIKLEQAKGQLEKIMKAADFDGVNSKGVFYEQITSLSRWLQFGINPKEVSVMQYVMYLNALQIEIKAIAKR
jgi:ribosomal protein S6